MEAAQKRETSEMLDKLKGVGNSILGTRGSSLLRARLTKSLQEISVYLLTIFNSHLTAKEDTQCNLYGSELICTGNLQFVSHDMLTFIPEILYYNMRI